MRNIKVIMAYRGTNYHGFQRQENAITVQQIVEENLQKLFRTPITIYGCSRTDSGVHANKYCFNFYTEGIIPCKNIIMAMNSKLPGDISFLSCEDVDSTFHARYSCVAKEYKYIINNSQYPDPFAEDLALYYRVPIDIDLLRQAAHYYVGTHDFKSFCSTKTDKTYTVRTIYNFDIDKDGNKVIMTVKGDGFLYNMVRIMVGTLLFVNEKKFQPEDIQQILESKNRMSAGKTVKAHGLYLNEIFYN